MNQTALQAMALLAEHGTADIPACVVGEKYFCLDPGQTARRIRAGEFPVKAYRLGGQKSPWLVSAYDLAEVICTERREAA